MGRIYLNDEWKFTPKYTDLLLYLSVDESSLTDVRLPHDFVKQLQEASGNEKPQLISGYRRVLRVDEAWKGKLVLFTCEGAGHKATLYVNGSEIYTHSCAYTSFTVDISQYLVYGQSNLLVMKVDSEVTFNQPSFGLIAEDTSFAGVYGEVYLDVKEKGHIQDAFIIANPGINGTAQLECRIDITREAVYRTVNDEWYIRGFIARYDTKECPLEKDERYIIPELIFDQRITDISLSLQIELSDIKNWYIEEPYLYELAIELYDQNENVKDTYMVTTGFRHVELRGDGLYLNGQKITRAISI